MESYEPCRYQQNGVATLLLIFDLLQHSFITKKAPLALPQRTVQHPAQKPNWNWKREAKPQCWLCRKNNDRESKASQSSVRADFETLLSPLRLPVFRWKISADTSISKRVSGYIVTEIRKELSFLSVFAVFVHYREWFHSPGAPGGWVSLPCSQCNIFTVLVGGQKKQLWTEASHSWCSQKT